MKILSYILMVSVFMPGAYGQDLIGDYIMPTEKGEIVLNLKKTENGNYSGELKDENGEVFILQNIENNNETLSGIISGSTGNLFFQTAMNGELLDFYLIPPDANSQPDVNNAIGFQLTKRLQKNPVLNQNEAAGGPLSGMHSSGKGWSGNYSGNINGTPSSLNITDNLGKLSGEIDADGYIYQLSGSVSGNNSKGQIKDPQTGGSMTYSAAKTGKIIIYTISYSDPGTGQQQNFQLQFEQSEPKIVQQGNQANVSIEGQRDPALIGGWRNSKSYTSDDFGMVSEIEMQLKADGTYLYGNGRVIGGGDSGSFDSGGGGNVNKGKWKSENSNIYIDEGYGWQLYCSYYVEGDSMLFKFSDGTNQLWERIF